MKLKNQLDGLDRNFSTTSNLKNGGTKKINIGEIKRLVDDIKSCKINNKKAAIDRYLKYIYENKIFLDIRNAVETIKSRKSKDKDKEKASNSYTVKKYLVILCMQCSEF